jgi:KaiC/GvpD/RAD55 family RecA-like ATPase
LIINDLDKATTHERKRFLTAKNRNKSMMRPIKSLVAAEMASNEPTPLKAKKTAKLQPSTELLARIAAARINPTDIIPKPPTAFSIGGEVIATAGNFMCITGRAKSRKTFLVSLFAAAAISSDEVQGINSELNGKVLYFDTEQSSYHVQTVANRVINLSKQSDYQNFEVYALRQFATLERLEMIETVLESNKENIGLVVIDGVRDLVFSINDESEATKIATKLLQWSALYNCQIITVLHQNKGDNNARGHIGTEILNKAELVISVTKNGESSEVKAEFSRGRDFEPFFMSVDESGLPYISEAPTPASNKISKEPHGFTSKHHDEILSKLTNSDLVNYQSLVAAISVKVSEVTGIQIGQNKAKEWISYYTTDGRIKTAQKPQKGYLKSQV